MHRSWLHDIKGHDDKWVISKAHTGMLMLNYDLINIQLINI